MANRPVFIVNEQNSNIISIEPIEFQWFAGLSKTQKQKSIESFHKKIVERFSVSDNDILEVSSKSKNQIGINLSAFNLQIITKKYELKFSVESAFQSSKIFEMGGPYLDILEKSSSDAKKDSRLRTSGSLIKFKFFGDEWPINPKTAFYDWLYINALIQPHNALLAQQILSYKIFTDIEFNPKKSFSCQAHSAAMFVSLSKKGLLDLAVSSKQEFIKIMDEFTDTDILTTKINFSK